MTNISTQTIFRLNHGCLLLPIKVLLFFFFFTAPFTAAQQGSPPINTLPPAPSFSPSLAVLMVIIISAFFVMGFFSVYIRQCTHRRYSRGSNFNPSSVLIGGGGRWSRRRLPGLEREVIDAFPTFLYSTVKGHKIGKESLECAVCLNEFEDDQMLRLIPRCSHVFHPDCIDAWLASHTTCPVCRANLVPKPGDVAFDSVSFFGPNNNNSVEPGQLQRSIDTNDQTQNDVLIHVLEEHDRNQQSPEVILPNTANQNRPPRSWSTGWRLSRLFSRSHSTGHSLVQPGENFDRFTLRLPEEVRNQLMNTHLNRTKSCVAFPRASSSKKGYRSRSGSSWRSRNFFYYERFDQEPRPDRSGLTLIPPFISRTGSVKGVGGGDVVRSKSTKKDDVGERSSDRLRGDDASWESQV